MSMLGWGNCNQIVPNMLYEQFGDSTFLQEQYDSMKAFVECEIRHFGKVFNKNLWVAPSLGDWLTLGKGVPYMAMHNGPVSNSFIVNDLNIMAQPAKMPKTGFLREVIKSIKISLSLSGATDVLMALMPVIKIAKPTMKNVTANTCKP